MTSRIRYSVLALLMIAVLGCEQVIEEATRGTPPVGQTAQVVRVIDGDTVDVRYQGTEVRVRYVGVNTPERDEPCYEEAVQANIALVQGQTVTMVRDSSDTDRFGRLLRYLYVGDTFVNEELIRQGVAESVLYGSDDEYFEDFSRLEQEAARAGRGCHPTGIFDDGSDTR
jgi:micrococcal nuclease